MPPSPTKQHTGRAGGDEAAGAREAGIAGAHHLVLPDIRHDDRLLLGSADHAVHDLAHPEHAVGGVHFRIDDLFFLHGVAAVESSIPRGVFPRLHPLRQEREDLLGVAAEAHLHRDDLPDLGGVDIYVDDFRLAGVGGDRTGHAVVEPHADGHEHVAGIRHDVRGHVAMHADQPAV